MSGADKFPLALDAPQTTKPKAAKTTDFFDLSEHGFVMGLGSTVTSEIAGIAMNSTGSPINISEALTGDFEKLMAESVRNSRKTGAYLRAKAKADTDRKGKK